MNFRQWYEQSQAQAKIQHISLAELDWLVLGITDLNRLELKLGEADLNPAQIQKLAELWQQRIEAKVPIQYLIGKALWRNLELHVSPDVLIPRPETEILIDLVLEMSDPSNPSTWVDLGTGSGALAISLALELSNAIVLAVDFSLAALEIARQNAKKYQVEDRLEFYHGSWFAALGSANGSAKRQFTGMVSNPPYIPSGELANLALEIQNHEPRLALDGGEDGLNCIRNLIQTAPEYLINGGFWLAEVMAGQAQTVKSLLEVNGNYANIQIHPDYDGIARFVVAKLK